MSYLVDTNVLSELRRRAPDPGVVEWLAKRPARVLFISVLTIGEIRKGVDSVPGGERRLKLLDWLETELTRFFAGRILPNRHRRGRQMGPATGGAATTTGCCRQPAGGYRAPS